MFIAAMRDWESGVYLSERIARQVAEARSGNHPTEGAAVVWRILPTGRRAFVARYQRGAIGAPRQHEPRPPEQPRAS